MIKKILLILKRILYKIAILKSDSYSVAKVYRKHLGIKIGDNVRFTGKKINFGSEPYLIEIGDNVTITPDVCFETHDGGVGIFRKDNPGINVFGKIKVGNNVFIGHRTIIMPGVTIGNNVVIGAGSVVTKDIEDNVVVAGVPARFIKSLEKYKIDSLKNAIYVFSTDEVNRKKEILRKMKK
jgi:acetyltransferase-like isoleucine patch superfamily enzyme